MSGVPAEPPDPDWSIRQGIHRAEFVANIPAPLHGMLLDEGVVMLWRRVDELEARLAQLEAALPCERCKGDGGWYDDVCGESVYVSCPACGGTGKWKR